MTRRRATRLLWATLALCVPVPFFLVETGQQPVASMLQMLAVVLALLATEGGAGAIAVAAAILAVQAAVALAVLGVVAVVVTRVLCSLAGDRGPALTLLVVASMLVVAMTQPIYRTPFRSTGLHATLGEVFE